MNDFADFPFKDLGRNEDTAEVDYCSLYSFLTQRARTFTLFLAKTVLTLDMSKK